MPVAVVSTYRVCMERFHAELSRLAELSFDRYGMDISTPLYLVGRKECGLDTHNPRLAIWAEFDVRAEEPDGWELVSGSHVPRNLTREALADWFRQVVKREPVWLFVD